MLPDATVSPNLHGFFLFATGLMCSWCGAVNATIFCDIVPTRHRATVFALDCAIEGGIAAFAAPVMGWLTVGFGYVVLPDEVADRTAISRSDHAQWVARRESNVAALGRAMGWCIVVPWMICLGTFVLLHEKGYYAHDRDAAHAAELAVADDADVECSGGGADDSNHTNSSSNLSGFDITRGREGVRVGRGKDDNRKLKEVDDVTFGAEHLLSTAILFIMTALAVHTVVFTGAAAVNGWQPIEPG